MADYGYGDAAPDSKYGYGDAPPGRDDPCDYGDARPDTSTDAYGYGDATPDHAAMYGYDDDVSYETGYNDQSTGNTMQPDPRSHARRHHQHQQARYKSDDMSVQSAATAESYGDYGDEPDLQQPRRQRYRRRGSVTKYSLDAQETVQKEYEQHDHVISQFRQLQDIPQSPMPMDASSSLDSSPLQQHGGDDDLLETLPDAKDHHKKKGKKKGIRRFTIGF